MNRRLVLAAFVAVVAMPVCRFAPPAAAAPTTITLTVDGLPRTALVEPGLTAATTPSPLVIVFHGLGDSPNEPLSQGIAKAWPEATVVYPQGLRMSHPEYGFSPAPGWQSAPGEFDDQDLRFVDTLVPYLGTLYKVDEQRVFVSGLSNGALFCYLLLAMRPQLFAGYVPVAGFAPPHLKWATVLRAVLATHGTADESVPLSLGELARNHVRRLNGCGGEEVPWAVRAGAPVSVSYQPCGSGQPVIWSLHRGGHIWPPQFAQNLARFCQDQALAAAPLPIDPPAGVDTSGSVAGTGSAGLSGDSGSAASARLFFPEGVALDRHGSLFIADTNNHRVRKVGPDGLITTVAGSIAGRNGNAIRQTTVATRATLFFPEQVAVGPDDSFYVADTYRHIVEKVTPDGVLSVVAGRQTLELGSIRYRGDDGPATLAVFSFPAGLALDPGGDLFIADTENHRVRKVTPDGNITTVAGTGVGGYAGDEGKGTAAQLNVPWGLALDRQGNLFIADSANHRVRKLAADGTITTVAGTGSAGFSGDGGKATAAQMNQPLGLVVDSQNNLFIVDSLNYRVRRVGPDGTISTVFGGGTGGEAVPAPRYYPSGIAVDRSGNLLIADPFHHRIWKVAGVATPGLVAGQPFPDPGSQ